jgi:4-amino-4-deoxychorismate lyase
MTPSSLINGRPGNSLDVRDRGLLYGDGLFDTLAVRDGRPQLWERHMVRLLEGCQRLRLTPADPSLLRAEADALCADAARGVLKIVLTRGPGARGYRFDAGAPGSRILTLSAAADYPVRHYRDGIAVRLCTTRLGCNPALAGIKHLNRLEQVLARAEWNDPDIAEGLMLDAGGRIIEGTMSNLFAVLDGVLVTPRLDECGVAGVMRDVIIEWAHTSGLPVAERHLVDGDLRRAKEVFLCNSLIGVWPVRLIDDIAWHPGPIAARVAAAVGALSLMPAAVLQDADAARPAGED